MGPYEVTALIGQGGMGEVYRARDTKLGRDVALKVLPDLFADDPERLARFQREARVLASLNHPNIATLYGSEEHEGIRYLEMELVEDPTLARHCSRCNSKRRENSMRWQSLLRTIVGLVVAMGVPGTLVWSQGGRGQVETQAASQFLAPATQVVAVRAGRLFDATSGTILTNQVVLIEGDRIADVGPAVEFRRGRPCSRG